MQNLHHAPVAILGAGRSGLAAAAWLAKLGACVSLFDDKPINSNINYFGFMPSASFVGPISECKPENFKMLVLSPGIPRTLTQVQKALSLSLPLVNEIEVGLFGLGQPKIVGVTGSNGKST